MLLQDDEDIMILYNDTYRNVLTPNIVVHYLKDYQTIN